MQDKETKHVAAFRDSHLKPGETIQLFLEGWIGEMMGKGDKTQHNGMFILTDDRACFYRKGIFGEVLETIPLPKITSIETLSLMGYRILRLHTSHDELAFKTFEQKELFDKAYARLEDLREADQKRPAPQAQAGTQPCPVEQLKKLGELRDAGILTEDEFATKKAELLARM
ncbi:MAG: SHOCT domain-containing protein [Sphingomonadales bacterium]|nr:SHOCT domain-containing protein [Sphingomonadales bacterium]